MRGYMVGWEGDRLYTMLRTPYQTLLSIYQSSGVSVRLTARLGFDSACVSEERKAVVYSQNLLK